MALIRLLKAAVATVPLLMLAGAALAQGTTFTQVERGRYLALAGDCASCHTAKGGKPFAGGVAVPTPFGTIYGANITPDKETGIGKWSRDDFYNALHSGVDRDGKHLYPAFPYPWFTRMTRSDVEAIKAFLDTVEPVHQRPPPPELPWPLSVRASVAGWNLLFFDEGKPTGDATKSAEWNRGAYLVEGPGHCAACHSAKNVLGGIKNAPGLHGGDAGEHWFAPSLRQGQRAGLGQWSGAEIVEYLKTGSNARGAAGGPMAEVVKKSTSKLTDADLNAIAVYLKDDAGAGGDKSDAADSDSAKPPNADSLAQGQALFVDNCVACHAANGLGVGNVFPPLKNSSSVQASKPDSVIRTVLEGAAMPATDVKPTGLAMPPFAGKFTNAEVAELVNFIRNSWGNRAPTTNASAVAKVRRVSTPAQVDSVMRPDAVALPVRVVAPTK